MMLPDDSYKIKTHNIDMIPKGSSAQDIDLHEYLINNACSTFFIRVQGYSMIGAGIFSGDILIVDKSIEPNSGDIIVAIVNEAFTVKRYVLENGQIILLPENPKFPSIKITEKMGFKIWGTVNYVIHKVK